MQQPRNNVSDRDNSKARNSQRIDTLDLELIFMNSIAICIILLAIVAADVFMR